MPRPSLITPIGKDEILQVALARAQLPTDVELAKRHGVSRRRVQQIMRAARDAFLRVCVVSNQDSATDTPAPCQSDAKAKS